MSILAILKGMIGGKLLEPLFEKALKKGIEKIETKLGKSVEEAKYDVTDEILYNSAVYSLSEGEAEEMDEFEKNFRKKDPQKTEAFVLFISKMIHVFEIELKEKKGKNKSLSYKDFSKGIRNAQIFLRALLKRRGKNPEETFQKRIEFLEGKHAFSLIDSMEKEGVGPIETIRNFFASFDEIDEVKKFNIVMSKIELEKQKVLVNFLNRLEPFQQKRFIKIIAKMNPGEKKAQDQRVDFLKLLISYIEKYGLKEAVLYFTNTGLIKKEDALLKNITEIKKMKDDFVSDISKKIEEISSVAKEVATEISKKGQKKTENFEKSGKSFVKKALTLRLWK